MGTPNFLPGNGRLVANVYDFEGHINGTAYRHTADEIDLLTPIVVNGQTYYTVSSVLLAIEGANAGGVFTIFPDGYDTYYASDASVLTGPPNQNFPYDSTVPSIDGILNDIFSNTNNPLHHRLRDGGVIVIPAGTYKIQNTINVPTGICVIGENYGTKLINQTSSVSFPFGQPLFSIQADSRIADNGAISGGSINKPFMFAKDNIFSNLVIADNFVEPKFVGDTSYFNTTNFATSALITNATNASPIQITTSINHNFVTGNTIFNTGINGNTAANGSFVITTVDALNFTLNNSAGNGAFATPDGYSYGVPAPLISQNEGSSLILDSVKFIGKVSYNGSSKPSLVTGSAVGTNSAMLAPNGTALSVRNCIFDGFAVPISFTTSAGVRDRLYCINNKIRCFGSALTLPHGSVSGVGDNFGAMFPSAPIVTNLSSMNITNNYLYTNYINNTLSVQTSMVLVQQSTLPMTALVSTTSGSSISPIQITTTIPNNYKTGQTITVSGVGGNTAANTTAAIIVINSTNFTLNGTTGNASYTSGGIATVSTPVNINISGNEITAINSNQVQSAVNERIIEYYGSIGLVGFTLFGLVNSSIYGNVNIFTKNVVGPLSLNIVNIGTTSPYTIVGDESVLVIPATNTTATINLGSTTMLVGKTITIKNIIPTGGVSITIHRLDNADKIETASSDYTMTTNLQAIRLVSDGAGNWMLI